MIDRPEPLFSIQQISRRLNLPKSTLRFWEKELEGFLLPVRTSGGQRRYNFANLAVIHKIKQLRDSGMSLAEIKSHLQGDKLAGDDDQRLGNIDLLAERIANAIKIEIHNYLSSLTFTDLK